MSSNIRIEKTCQHCGEKFIAKTSVTKFCGDRCAKLAYKKRKRDEKIKLVPKENDLAKLHGPDKIRLARNVEHTLEPLALLESRNYFSISQTSTILGVSERTLFRMIKRRQIKTFKIGGRTLIKKNELLPYFS